MSDPRPRRQAREPWATPWAVTRPVFVALAALVTLGMAAVLGGAAIRAHLHPGFRPDWAVWAPTTLAVGVGVLGLGALALLSQRRPPPPMTPAGPLPQPIAPGTMQALRRGGPLTAEQAASAQQLVDGAVGRRPLVAVWLGPFYVLLGLFGVVAGSGPGWGYVTIGAVMTPLGIAAVLSRRRTLRGAAELGIRPTTAPDDTLDQHTE